MTTRRGFLTGILALGAAPAIVRAESLMRLWVPPQELLVADWTLDDRYYRGNVEQPIIFVHPAWEEAMREIAIYGGATIVCHPEVRRHG